MFDNVRRASSVAMISLLVVASGCHRESVGQRPAAPQNTRIASASPSGSMPPGPINMTDATKTSGLRFVHQHGGGGRHYMAEQFAGGCAFIDFDADGWQDLFFPQGAPLPDFKAAKPLRSALYRNNKNGTFSDVTKDSGLDIEMYGMAPTVGDYDNDGLPDLYVTALGENHLFHNEGNGRFLDVTRRAGVFGKDMDTSTMWVDYDRDGWLDLFICRYTEYSLSQDVLCKDPTGRIKYCLPESYKPTNQVLYHNNGDGTFTDVSMKSGIARHTGRALGVAPIDINEDGWIDIYVACDETPNLLFVNKRNGTFREEALAMGLTSATPYGGMGVDSGDYRNDGRSALVVTNFNKEPISLYSNQGNGTFAHDYGMFALNRGGSQFVKWGCRFVDLDLDGFQDLFIVNGHVDDSLQGTEEVNSYAQPCQLFRNENGHFTGIGGQSGEFFLRQQVGRGAAFGDYDNDGDIDVLIACNNQPAILLRNDSPQRHHSIRIILRGSARLTHKGCNRDALGTRVRVQANNMTQTQVARSGTSYMADHDRRLVFGIGQKEQATVEVTWPCGAVQKLRVGAGKTAVIQETNCKIARNKYRRLG